MSRRLPQAIRASCVAAVLIVSALAATPPIRGCAIIGRSFSLVNIADEAAIIIWDATTQTQHFIRYASFQAKNPGANFGFLVPTPTQPTLAEAAKEAFDTITGVMIPPRKEAISWEFWPLVCCPVVMLGTNASKTFSEVGVRILHEQHVGGYDAVVLEADNGKELNEWLGKNGYVSRPAFVDWLDHYVKAKWKITAFKIADDISPAAVPSGEYKSVASGTVRMSFKTEKPFFPYREPADSTGDKAGGVTSRLMRVFFVGTERMAGWLGEASDSRWTAHTRWSDRLPASARETLVKQLALESVQVPAEAWLTAFEDRSLRRPEGNDLFFATSPDQRPVVPPPLTAYTRTIWVPVDVVTILVIACVYVLVRRLRAPGPGLQPGQLQ